MVKQSIYMARWIIHLAIVAVMVAMAVGELKRNAPRKETVVIVQDGYELTDGKRVWLRLNPTDVAATDAGDAHSWLGSYRDSMAAATDYVRKCLAEADYFLQVHAVQDEGYGQVVSQRDDFRRQLASRERQLALLDSLCHDNGRLFLKPFRRTVAQDSLPMPDHSICIRSYGWYQGGLLPLRPRWGKGISVDCSGRLLLGEWNQESLAKATIFLPEGIYEGSASACFYPEGHGRLRQWNGAVYEGRWENGRCQGFGIEMNDEHLKAGEWRNGKFLGERMNYTSERIYGIDISRYQHGKGRKYYPIHWNRLRINYLGKVNNKRNAGNSYPVSFVYIKSTEGTTVRNRYYRADYQQARRNGIACGAYHFFSTRTSGSKQAQFFLRHARFAKGDFPPVLDVEPSHRQICEMGGPDALFREVREWLRIVEKKTGVLPVLYVSQSFVNRYLRDEGELKRKYPVWIARYGEYKPDVKLVFWQLCSDGRVQGITGDVDINVFNGYDNQFQLFKKEQTIR